MSDDLDTILREVCDLAVKKIAEDGTGVFVKTEEPVKLRALLYRFFKRESCIAYSELMISPSLRGDSEIWITKKRTLARGNPRIAFKDETIQEVENELEQKEIDELFEDIELSLKG